MIAGIMTALAGMAAAIGPFALAGGPIGLGVAWLGSLAANKTVKIVAILGGLALLVGTAVAVTVHWQHLERDSAAYRDLSASTDSLEQKYGCTKREPHEQALAACLTARERDAADAQRAEIDRQRKLAAEEQARLDREAASLDVAKRAEEQAIDQDAAHDDGTVPKALLNSWDRERAERGLK